LTINPEIIELENILNNLGIDQDQLIVVAMLVGTDYNINGIKNIGQKKALKLVKQYENDFSELFKDLKWDEHFNYSWQEVFYLIKNMPVANNYKLEWKKPDQDQIKKILIDKHDFSEERVIKTISKLFKTENKKQQKPLGKWL